MTGGQPPEPHQPSLGNGAVPTTCHEKYPAIRALVPEQCSSTHERFRRCMVSPPRSAILAGFRRSTVTTGRAFRSVRRRLARWPRTTCSRSEPLAPLATRMRPRSLSEFRGQTDVLRQGSPLRRLIDGAEGAVGPLSAIIWGPPGTGKTTLAHLVATAADRRFVQLSAVTAGVQGRAGRHGLGRPRARAVRPAYRALPRRDPPLHQGPAGRPAARRREPPGHPRRGDDREPVLQHHLPAAVAVGGHRA